MACLTPPAGEPILDIVPDEEKLLIEARVSPTDINVVHPGLAAQVHLTTFSKRAMPRIDGAVRSVSADRLVDPESSQRYYMARLEVARSELEQLGSAISLVPGMPAEVLIVIQGAHDDRLPHRTDPRCMEAELPRSVISPHSASFFRY